MIQLHFCWSPLWYLKAVRGLWDAEVDHVFISDDTYAIDCTKRYGVQVYEAQEYIPRYTQYVVGTISIPLHTLTSDFALLLGFRSEHLQSVLYYLGLTTTPPLNCVGVVTFVLRQSGINVPLFHHPQELYNYMKARQHGIPIASRPASADAPASA